LTNPPVARWVDMDYMHRVLLEPPSTLDNPGPPGNYLPRIRIWQVLNFSFIDQRAILPEDA